MFNDSGRLVGRETEDDGGGVGTEGGGNGSPGGRGPGCLSGRSVTPKPNFVLFQGMILLAVASASLAALTSPQQSITIGLAVCRP